MFGYLYNLWQVPPEGQPQRKLAKTTVVAATNKTTSTKTFKPVPAKVTSPAGHKGPKSAPDMNEYDGQSVVYLIHVTDAFYKFGVTSNIIERYNRHRVDFARLGQKITLVKIWQCESAGIMSRVEAMIKVFGKQNGAMRAMYGKTEILEMTDIRHLLAAVDKYVAKENQGSVRVMQNENLRLTAEIERLKLETEKIRQENLRLMAAETAAWTARPNALALQSPGGPAVPQHRPASRTKKVGQTTQLLRPPSPDAEISLPFFIPEGNDRFAFIPHDCPCHHVGNRCNSP